MLLLARPFIILVSRTVLGDAAAIFPMFVAKLSPVAQNYGAIDTWLVRLC